MTIQPIGDRAAALTLTAQDLGGVLSPLDLSPADTLSLVRSALASAGLTLPAPLELEAYPDRRGLLLLVRSLPPSAPRPLPIRAPRRRPRRT